MHYLKLDRCVPFGQIVANVTFFFTLAIASLRVEIEGARHQENGTGKPLHVEGEREKTRSLLSPLQFSFYAPVLISHLSPLSKRPD